MAFSAPEKDLARSKELRKLANDAQDPTAKQVLKESAARLERQGAKKASKLGRVKTLGGHRAGGGPRKGGRSIKIGA